MEEIRILHLSDTHNHHRDISADDMPPADIFIHTGDFTNDGLEEEFEDFNNWLGEISSNYSHIIVIGGNHDWRDAYKKVKAREIDASVVIAPNFLQDKLRNAIVVDHTEICIRGIRIFGSSWVPWHVSSCPENSTGGKSGQPQIWAEYARNYREIYGLDPCPHRFNEIPEGVDILLTHGPAFGIMDSMENGPSQWGSSAALREAIHRAAPKVHLFGHLHEQRGAYVKKKCVDSDREVFAGGVHYCYPRGSGKAAYTLPPPEASDYPCQVISCNAMLNHSHMERGSPYIAGRPRLIVARRMGPDCPWDFSVPDEYMNVDTC